MKVGIDLSELKNELKEIKKKNNNEKNIKANTTAILIPALAIISAFL